MNQFTALQTPPQTSNMAWLLPYQKAQEIHDRLYCRDVACMSPPDRAAFLAMLIAKYVANIQADFYTANAAHTTGKRITDILITTMSLLTSMGVSIAERLEKLKVPSHVNGEQALMQWLVQNYVYDIGGNHLSVHDVYERQFQYSMAMPHQLHRLLDSAENIQLMQMSTNARSDMVNAAMHLWIQCVVSHSVAGHSSFIRDMTERLQEVEQKNIHHSAFGLFPNFRYESLYQ